MSLPLYRFKKLDRSALMAELLGSRLTNLVSYSSSQTATTLGSSVTQANAQTCFDNIYGYAAGVGYSQQQSAQIAGVALSAYTGALAAGGSVSQAQQAATAAAITKVAIIAAYELLSGDAGALLEAAELAAALGAALGGQPTSSQQAAAQNVIDTFATSLGISL